MARPNLFLVGAAKSGTTSLANYLDQHPDIFVSAPKEPNFFALAEGEPMVCHGPLPSERLVELLLAHSVTDSKNYFDLFQDAADRKFRVDASVRYLYSETAVDRVAKAAPDAQIVALLREPIDRLHSHYHMNVRLGVEPESFERALQLEDERFEQGWGWDWHYTRVGNYGQQLQRYFDRFSSEQIHVMIYDDFEANPREVLNGLYAKLGVSTDIHANTEQRSNVGQTPKYRVLRKLLWEDNLIKRVAQKLVPKSARAAVSQWVEKRNRAAIPTVPIEVRNQLAVKFQQDQEHLESLLGRKLPW